MDLKNFLKKFQVDPDTEKYFQDNNDISRRFETVLNKLNSPEELDNKIRTFLKIHFEDDFHELLNNELIEIGGNQILIEINYNPERFDLKYSYKN